VGQDKHRPSRRLWLAGVAGVALLAAGCATAGQRQDQFGAEWHALTPAGNEAENSMQKGGSSYGS
jgi:hypothetical protein